MNNMINNKKYVELLAETIPTVISTESEYDRIEVHANSLKRKGEDLTPEETAVLQLLLALMQHYENVKINRFSSQCVKSQPNEVLKELMQIRGLKPKDIYIFFGGHKSNTSAILNGKREISKEQAKYLANFFNVSAALFI